MRQNHSLLVPVLAGNWKMYKGPTATREFFALFCAHYAPHPDRTVLFCPPAVSLGAAQEALLARPDLQLGVQNIHWTEEGAFTGETSALHAREAGASFALIGHSERRHLFGETDDEVRRKVSRALDHDLIPVVCVGETLEERHAQQVEAVIARQLEAALAGVPMGYQGPFLVAYEPVWAIGTGVTAAPADAIAAHALLRGRLETRFPGVRVPILYGGSVKPNNARDLLVAQGVDGLLVGGASLDPIAFAEIASTG
ncbi:MAG: triose-phosphate isomerase [Longimicrobiales bacterium]